MTSILTVTLNPTIDVSSEAEIVRPVRKIRTTAESYDPGGGGINVARVINELGGRCHAVFLAGGTTGKLLDELLEKAGIGRSLFPISGRARICYTVFESKSGLEYRFVPAGPAITEAELAPLIAHLERDTSPFVVVSGSMPPGLPPDVIVRIADSVAARGGKLILDCSGDALRATLERSRVFLVKPSRGELEQYVGRALDEDGIGEAATALVRRGAAELVAVTMGAEGALLASTKGTLRLPSLHVPVCSAVGAGDSFLAAMTLALAKGKAPETAFRFGTAAGAATAMTPGTKLCRRSDVERLHAALEARTASDDRHLAEQ